eukprot:9485139-Pyramimonas_sp.AAC.1
MQPVREKLLKRQEELYAKRRASKPVATQISDLPRKCANMEDKISKSTQALEERKRRLPSCKSWWGKTKQRFQICGSSCWISNSSVGSLRYGLRRSHLRVKLNPYVRQFLVQ